MGEWRNYKWAWKLHWRCHLHSWEEDKVTELQAILERRQPRQDQVDTWQWSNTANGKYIVQSAYLLLNSKQPMENKSLYNKIWNPLVSSKVSTFNWQAMYDRIPSCFNLFKCGVLHDSNTINCVFCGLEAKDTHHLLLHCKNSTKLWTNYRKWWGVASLLPNHCTMAYEQQLSLFNNKKMSARWGVVWEAGAWSLWLARNEMIFNGKPKDPRKLFELTQLRSFFWIKAKAKNCFFTFSD
ncbi:hypothetical protein SLA2020_101140 [Shorea laevis]